MSKLTTLILTTTFAAFSQGALAAASAPTAAPAQVDDARQLTVRFADLDLAHPEGAAKLYHRLHNAAEAVCSSLESRELSRIDESENRASRASGAPCWSSEDRHFMQMLS
jgi:UrcA family protein